MLLLEQLSFFFTPPTERSTAPEPPQRRRTRACASRRDHDLESQARELLGLVGATALVPVVAVEWNARLRSAAGRAHYHRRLVSLNPRLQEHGPAEIDRTLRHELAHLVAHMRAGRRRISPHGPEWRRACRDLGIADEQRCHSLPFPVQQRKRRFHYLCPRCGAEFPRVTRIRRSVACLACCRRHNGGKFHPEFRLVMVVKAPHPSGALVPLLS